MFTPVSNKGHDQDARAIRSRKCRDCGRQFGTVEVVLPEEFSFTRTDIYRDTRRKPENVARYSSDRIFIGSVKVIKGKRTNWCVKGLHHLLGKNLVINSSKGKAYRSCRACANDRRALRRFENKDAMNLLRRQQRALRKEQHGTTGTRTPHNPIAEQVPA